MKIRSSADQELAAMWQCSPARNSFSKYQASWDSLNQKLFLGHPLGDPCFVGPLIKYFAEDGDFLAVRSTGSEHENMLLLSSKRFGLVESFRPAQTEICPVLINSLDELQVLFDQLPATTQVLQLYCQDPDYNVFPSTSSSLICDIDHHAYTVCIDLVGDFASYWQARPVKLQKNIERSLRALAEADIKWRFVVRDSPDEVGLAVDRYGDLEIQGWKRAAGTAVHRDNIQGKFYREVLHRFAERGNGLVYELYFDDCLVGSQLAIGNDSILITLKTSYNESFSKFSPGKIVDYLTLHREFELGRFSKVEFCTNAGPDLMRWGNRIRPISHLSVYRNKHAQRIVRLYWKLKGLKNSLLPAGPD